MTFFKITNFEEAMNKCCNKLQSSFTFKTHLFISRVLALICPMHFEIYLIHTSKFPILVPCSTICAIKLSLYTASFNFIISCLYLSINVSFTIEQIFKFSKIEREGDFEKKYDIFEKSE